MNQVIEFREAILPWIFNNSEAVVALLLATIAVIFRLHRNWVANNSRIRDLQEKIHRIENRLGRLEQPFFSTDLDLFQQKLDKDI
jgi:hypothetical protein